MTPNEIIVQELREFWAAPKLAEAILARLAAEGYAITAASAASDSQDIPTVILGSGLVTLEPIVREDRMVAGILFKQMAAAQGVNERVSMEALAQAKPVLQILSTKPQSFIALADVCDQAIRLFSPAAGVYDIACGIYSSIHEATGWRSNVVHILEFAPKSINMFNGTTRFGGGTW